MSGAALRALRAGDPERVGPYRLLARLGTGGMGQVYLGSSQGRRSVAVKVVHPHLADSAVFRRRFTKEVAAARRIGGFYTAQVVDADPPWLVTEYIAGPTLQDAVDENGALPEAAVAALGAGLAEGLRAIHDQNMIHRDLKPGNVLLARDGPRIIDFGIARAMDAPTQTVSMVGTPGYMSPEQYLGGDLGPASDVFCLAAVLAFAATGRHPFGEGPGDALGYRVRHEDPNLTGAPESLRPLIAAGLEKDSGDRPPVGEFLDRCSALATGEGMSLPRSFTTMIATRVAETEVFAGKATTGGREERPRQDPPPPRWQPRQESAQGRPPGERHSAPHPPANPPPHPPARPPARPPVKPNAGGVAVGAGVVGVLLVAVLIFLANNDESGPSSARSSPTSTETPTATPSRMTDVTGDGGSSQQPSPTPDPTWEAFDDISVGDCLDALKDPYDSSEWTEDMPNAVSCGRSDAYVKVTGVRSSSSSCDSKSLDGESWWRSPTHDGDNLYLCLRRQFREGECFLGEKGSKKGLVAINGHGLMTSWDCDKTTVPKAFDYILKFTGYYESRCPSGSRTWEDFREGVFCARVV
ncbi:serine/threonine-protein kinase [Spirillospora sp. NBC_01491]|uniref:serine/threonine-protein kinase n=1 Tax=Spirillospora sp. NBC_01491 TaxID=2976007 RepID=UPI002E3089FF|nr:serine/threonine-protein kinase [Spirillospora sp. NBC_01491]